MGGEQQVRNIFTRLVVFSAGSVLLLTATLLLLTEFHSAEHRAMQHRLQAEQLADRIRFAVLLNKEKLQAVSSRTMIRIKLHDYHHRKISGQDLKKYTEPKYRDGCRIFTNLAAARRTAKDGTAVASFGNEEYFKQFGDEPQTGTLHITGKECLLYLENPIIHRRTLIGRDAGVFYLGATLPELNGVFAGKRVIRNGTAAPRSGISLPIPGSDALLWIPPGQLPNSEEGSHHEVQIFAVVLLLLLIAGFRYIVYRPVKNMTFEYITGIRKLEQTVLERDRFFSIIAHDLRGPLGGLLQFSTYVEQNWEELTDPSRQEAVADLTETAGKVIGLLENLLTWSQVQLGRIHAEPEAVDPEPVCRDAFSLWQLSINQKQLHTTLSVESSCRILCDRSMLYAIIRNLTANAVKFTPPYGEISITVRDLIGFRCMIEIRDTGKGMDRQQTADLFTPGKNRSTPGTGGETGTGLGMPLVHDLIKLNRGTISVNSTPGKGTVVQCIFEKASVRQ